MSENLESLCQTFCSDAESWFQSITETFVLAVIWDRNRNHFRYWEVDEEQNPLFQSLVEAWENNFGQGKPAQARALFAKHFVYIVSKHADGTFKIDAKMATSVNEIEADIDDLHLANCLTY